jgi:hypothetical protein
VGIVSFAPHDYGTERLLHGLHRQSQVGGALEHGMEERAGRRDGRARLGHGREHDDVDEILRPMSGRRSYGGFEAEALERLVGGVGDLHRELVMLRMEQARKSTQMVRAGRCAPGIPTHCGSMRRPRGRAELSLTHIQRLPRFYEDGPDGSLGH